MDVKDIAEQAYKNGYAQAVKDMAGKAKDEAFVVFMGEPIIRASKIDEIAKELTEEKAGG